jgi:hypothetical protein
MPHWHLLLHWSVEMVVAMIALIAKPPQPEATQMLS